jgi:hypothetical protein
MRLILSLLLIVGALAAALLLHQELTNAGGQTAKAASRQDRSRDLLQLSLGEAPVLVVDRREEKRPLAPEPEPGPLPDPQPGPSPAPQRFVFLEAGGTISGIAHKHLGKAARANEVLELNGWTEADARSLRPGTKVLLPTR